MTRDQFANLLMLIAGAKLRKLETFQLNAWWELAKMRQDVPDEAWKAAAVKLASSTGDWPTYDKLVSEAVEHIHGLPEPAMKSFERILAASKVWYAGCEESCQRALSMITPDDNEAIRAMGGWDKFQSITGDSMSILRGQFRKHWESNQFQTRRMLNLPEQVRPNHKRVELDRDAVAAVAARLRLEDNRSNET